MQRALYSLGIELYWLVGFVYSFFNKKARKWYLGNKNLLPTRLPAKQKKRIWFHISSLGEYEQAKPVIKGLVDEFEIVLTFFSPSGYEAKNVREYTDWVFYLGKDSKSKAKQNKTFIDPDFFVLVKYDFWLNHLIELQKAQVKTILISGLFRKKQVFFKRYGGLFRNALAGLYHLFLQNEDSATLLKTIGIEQTTVNGDTRVDSVLQNVPIALDKLPQTVKDFAQNQKCLVVGSSYRAEEQIIVNNLNGCLQDWKILIAPHNLDEKHLIELESCFGTNATFLSKLKGGKPKSQVLIVDQIGLLKYLYAIADVAFVGGGFGKTVHNTLEPAAFGIPILFGPKHHDFNEAVYMVKSKGAFVIKESSGFKATLKLASSDSKYGTIAKDFILSNSNSLKPINTFFKSN